MGRVQKLPYGKRFIELDLNKLGSVQLVEPNPVLNERDEEVIVREALEHPMGSISLKELTKGVKKILIITNDNTRPMPSKITIPAIIRSFYWDERYYDITILIANGLHREMKEDEMREQFGEEICSKYRIVNHNASDRTQLVDFGRLSSGNVLWLNKLLVEHDLIISEGFIEPHFFAGYSGGRKSILPGVAGEETILHNHRPENIASPYATGANLDGNPIHKECQEAAKMGKLAFILNVALDRSKKIVGAFAGDPVKAHTCGCEYVKRMMSVAAKRTDIVITTNNGYPLDRNLYQVVKGIDTASKIVKEGGVIIVAAECMEKVGHKNFEDLILSCRSVEELHCKMSSPPSTADKWQVQILARALKKYKIILVSDGIDQALSEKLFLIHAVSIEEAVKKAFSIKGTGASVTVMPEGPVTIPVVNDEIRCLG